MCIFREITATAIWSIKSLSSSTGSASRLEGQSKITRQKYLDWAGGFYGSCSFFWQPNAISRGMSCVAVRHQSCAITHTQSNNQRPQWKVFFLQLSPCSNSCFWGNAVGIPLFPNSCTRMFCRSCCCCQLQITELFLGPVCCCRLVWLVGLQFYNHPWHLLLKPCPCYLWLNCCCFSVLCTTFNLLRALPEIPVQEVCSMASPRRARFPSERRQRHPTSKGTHQLSGSV